MARAEDGLQRLVRFAERLGQYDVQFRDASPVFVDVGPSSRSAWASPGWPTGSSASCSSICCCSRPGSACRSSPGCAARWKASGRGEMRALMSLRDRFRREDPIVRRLLAAKPEGTHPDHDEAFFERMLGEAFDVERREVLSSGTRVLDHARPR